MYKLYVKATFKVAFKSHFSLLQKSWRLRERERCLLTIRILPPEPSSWTPRDSTWMSTRIRGEGS